VTHDWLKRSSDSDFGSAGPFDAAPRLSCPSAGANQLAIGLILNEEQSTGRLDGLLGQVIPLTMKKRSNYNGLIN
jgi:hypothetical protein